MANNQNNRGNTNTDRDSEGRFTSDSNRSSNASSNRSHGDTSNRGFASMDKDKQRQIARKGGEASHGGQGRSSSSSSWDDE